MAFVNQIGIVYRGIGVGNARPVGGVAKVGSGYIGKGIALLNDDACGRPESRGYRRQKKVRACHDVVRVNDSWIHSDQIVPAKAFPKILLRQLPK